MDHDTGEHGIQGLIPPDSGKRDGERPGWTSGRYSLMRRVLASDVGRELYRKRQQSMEPVYGHTKHNRKIYCFNYRGRLAVRTEWRVVLMPTTRPSSTATRSPPRGTTPQAAAAHPAVHHEDAHRPASALVCRGLRDSHVATGVVWRTYCQGRGQLSPALEEARGGFPPEPTFALDLTPSSPRRRRRTPDPRQCRTIPFMFRPAQVAPLLWRRRTAPPVGVANAAMLRPWT
jgi:hypothetical protein